MRCWPQSKCVQSTAATTTANHNYSPYPMSRGLLVSSNSTSASLDATRRTHSKTFRKTSRQRVVSGALGRGASVPTAGHAQARTEQGSSHADRFSMRVTESRVPTDHQAPGWHGVTSAGTRALGRGLKGSRDDSKSPQDCSPEPEARANRQVRTRPTTHNRSTTLAMRTRVDHFSHGGSHAQ